MAKLKPFPKSMGACADLLADTREKRLAADKVAEALKAEENRLKEHIINSLDKSSTGAAGKHHMVRVIIKQKPQVREWDKFYAYVHKNKAFDLLQRRLSETAIIDRMMEARGKKLPGIEMFNTVDVSLTKVK